MPQPASDGDDVLLLWLGWTVSPLRGLMLLCCCLRKLRNTQAGLAGGADNQLTERTRAGAGSGAAARDKNIRHPLRLFFHTFLGTFAFVFLFRFGVHPFRSKILKRIIRSEKIYSGYNVTVVVRQ